MPTWSPKSYSLLLGMDKILLMISLNLSKPSLISNWTKSPATIQLIRSATMNSSLMRVRKTLFAWLTPSWWDIRRKSIEISGAWGDIISLIHALVLSGSFWCYIPIYEHQYLYFVIIAGLRYVILPPLNTMLIIPVDKLIVSIQYYHNLNYNIPSTSSTQCLHVVLINGRKYSDYETYTYQ